MSLGITSRETLGRFAFLLFAILTCKAVLMASTEWNMINSRKEYKVTTDSTKGPVETQAQTHRYIFSLLGHWERFHDARQRLVQFL